MTKLLPILILLTSFSKAQISFCPAGAEWRSLFTDYWPSPGTLNEKASYLKDTVIGTETLKVIEHRRFFMTNTGVFTRHSLIRQRGDTIFIKNTETQNGWQILYNYAAQAGQSWITNLSNGTTFTVQVDSVKFKAVNGFNLKHLYVTYKSSYHPAGYYKTYIAERMGSPFLFNYEYMPGTDGNYLVGPLCYKDTQFGLLQFGAKSCTYENPTGIGEANPSQNLTVWPNPVSSRLTIKSPEGLSCLTISNALGQVVRKLDDPSAVSMFDMTALAAGIYYLRFDFTQGIGGTIKVVKQ